MTQSTQWTRWLCPKDGPLTRAATALAFDAKPGDDALICAYCQAPVEEVQVALVAPQELPSGQENGLATRLEAALMDSNVARAHARQLKRAITKALDYLENDGDVKAARLVLNAAEEELPSSSEEGTATERTEWVESPNGLKIGDEISLYTQVSGSEYEYLRVKITGKDDETISWRYGGGTERSIPLKRWSTERVKRFSTPLVQPPTSNRKEGTE